VPALTGDGAISTFVQGMTVASAIGLEIPRD